MRNANGKISLATWQKEHSELAKKVVELEGKYQTLKTKVAQANRFRVRIMMCYGRKNRKRNLCKNGRRIWNCRQLESKMPTPKSRHFVEILLLHNPIQYPQQFRQ